MKREISCEDATAFVDGELSDDDAIEYREHLRECRDCRESVLEAGVLSAQLSMLAPTELEQLKQLVRTWAAADDAWDESPLESVRFEQTWILRQAARDELRAAVGVLTAPARTDWPSAVWARIHNNEEET